MLIAEKSRQRNKAKAIPESLIYEIIDGKPFYYDGYKDVLANKKTSEEIMGASGLQSYIIYYLLKVLYAKLDDRKYRFLTNEIGTHLDKNNNLSGDIYIYDKQTLSPDKINTHYVEVAPKIAIEIDIRIDLSDEKDFGYVFTKTHKLLDFGVEKVLWIFTKHQKVMVATKDQDWLTKNWNQEIELLDGEYFNIGKFLADEGVEQ
ncbi:Uma2 family endonuclease [Emticicia sp. W12TSBA100-4]|uniref:Uma2 family endonuclease n=1 Tax=Emticicia sp. W12TSBA100-4 TaxID=3160965 RepID=UPI003306103E